MFCPFTGIGYARVAAKRAIGSRDPLQSKQHNEVHRKMYVNSRSAARILLITILACASHATSANDRLGLPPLPVPEDNSLTPEKVALGRELFLDTRFSADGTISCASCHVPTQLFTDGRVVGVGIDGKEGTRNAPTIINAAYYDSLFWDGRAASLEAQAKGPLINPIEHGLSSYEPALKVIRSDRKYMMQFEHAFGIAPEKIDIDDVVKAIASFERTLIAGDSAFDRYRYGGDPNALSASAIAGFKVFTGRGKCSVCHLIGKSSATLTDNQYHNIGVSLPEIQGRLNDVVNAFIESKLDGRAVDHSVLTAENISQLGRFAVTLNPTDIGNFRTPSLRNVALTAPYMHDGSLKTLEDVVAFYAKGGSGSSLQHPMIRKLRLTKTEERQLVDFMESLTSAKFVGLVKPGNGAAKTVAGENLSGGSARSAAAKL